MRLILLAAALILAALPLAPAEPAARAANQHSNEEKELRKLDGEWWRAVAERDAEALHRLLADDYTLLEPSGGVRGKAEEIAAIKSPLFALTLRSYRTEEVAIRLSGERATLTGRAVLKVEFEGEFISRRFWYMRAFAKRQGQWQIVSTQFTSLPDDD